MYNAIELCCIISKIWISRDKGASTVLIELEERTKGHVAYANIERLFNVLDQIDTTSIDTKHQQMIGRIYETFVVLKEALDRIDPWLISIQIMNNINAQVAEILNNVNNYLSNPIEQYLSNAIAHIEALLTYFPHITVTKTPEDIEGVKASVVSFRRSVGTHLSNVEREATDAAETLRRNTAKLTELTTDIENQRARVDSVVTDIQGQFLQAQTQRSEEFTNLIRESEKEFKSNLTSYNKTVEKVVLSHEETFKDITEQFNQLTEGKRVNIDATIRQFSVAFETEKQKLEEMNKEAETILGHMSMKGLAQGYKKIANSEAWQALAWNVISILSLLGILWFGYEFIIKHDGEMSWTTLVSRMILTGVGITLFTYCARQAGNHKNEERRNRKIELELASLDPYLKDLDEPEQKKVKQDLVNKYFGVELPSTPTVQQAPIQQQNITDSLTSNPQFIQALVEKVTQAISKP